MKRLLLAVMFVFAVVPLHAQQSPINVNAWEFLFGDWVSDSSAGVPGNGTGSFSFEPDLQNNIIIRRNHAAYPAQNGRPAFTHDDMMVIYRGETEPLRALYADNEGHVIHYSVTFPTDSEGVIFISDSLAGQPRFRLTYVETGENTVNVYFAIAPPSRPTAFKDYATGRARRKGARR